MEINFQCIDSKQQQEQLSEIYVVNDKGQVCFYKNMIIKGKQKEFIPIYQQGQYELIFIQHKEVQQINILLNKILKNQEVAYLFKNVFKQVQKNQQQTHGIYDILIQICQKQFNYSQTISCIYAQLFQQVLNKILQQIHLKQIPDVEVTQQYKLQNLLDYFYGIQIIKFNVSSKQSIIKTQQQNILIQSPFINFDFYQPQLEQENISWRIKQTFQNNYFSVYSQNYNEQSYSIIPRMLINSKTFYQQKQGEQIQTKLVLMQNQDKSSNQIQNLKFYYQKIIDTNAIKAKTHCGAFLVQDMNDNYDVISTTGQTVYNIPLSNLKQLRNKHIYSKLQTQKSPFYKQNLTLIRAIKNNYIYVVTDQKGITTFGLIDTLGQIQTYLTDTFINNQLKQVNQQYQIIRLCQVAYNRENFDQYIVYCFLKSNKDQQIQQYILIFDKFNNLLNIIQFSHSNAIIQYDKLDQKIKEIINEQKILNLQFIASNKILLIFELYVCVLQIDTQEICFSIVQSNMPFKMYNQVSIVSISQAQFISIFHRRNSLQVDGSYSPEQNQSLNDQILTSVTEDSDEFITSEQNTNQISTNLLNYNYVGQYIPHKLNSVYFNEYYEVIKNNLQINEPLQNKIICAQTGLIKKQSFIVIIYKNFAVMYKISTINYQLILTYTVKFKQFNVVKASVIFLSDSIELVLTTSVMSHFVNIGTFGELRSMFATTKPIAHVCSIPNVLQQKSEQLGAWK